MARPHLFSDEPLVRLRWRWWLITIISMALIWLGYQLLRAEWPPTTAWRWTLGASGVLAIELAFVWRSLKNNHRQGELTLLPTLGAGNHLTLLRGLLFGLLAGFLLIPRPTGTLAWLPALLYTLAIIVDLLDGYLARITHQATVLGEMLDIEYDALGMLVAATLVVRYGQLPWWFLTMGLARYLFLCGIWLRRRQGKPVCELPRSVHGRMIAGFEMGFVSVMLWPLFHPPATVLAGAVFATPVIGSFTRDWFIVSGVIDPNSPSYLEAKRKITLILTHWLPVGIRATVVPLTVIVCILPLVLGDRDPVAMFAWPLLPLPGVTATLISLIVPIATILLILGAAGRLAALALLVAASAHVLSQGLDVLNGYLLVSTNALMILGSGAFSCWRPEEPLLKQRAGEK
jgi:CDP-diacylglycerol--glycerol-3-phosphate 3-phosphatidyltransferase